mgnify:CR=1 FL=1|jgi:hypothetical protein
MFQHLSSALLGLDLDAAKWTQPELEQLFKDLQTLMFGKVSVIKQMTYFAYHTQLYDIPYTDLDEVTAVMQNLIEGLRYYVAAGETLNSLYKNV